MNEEEEFQFRARLEAERAAQQQAPTPVERFNAQQKRMGLGKQGDTMGDIRRARDQAVYDFGGKVTDVTGSPGAGSLANAAADVATDPMTYAGGAVGKGAKALAEIGATKLMWSALKPDKASRQNGDAIKAVKTLLDEGVNVTEGGVEKLTSKIDALDSQLESVIKSSKAKLLNTDVLQSLRSMMKEYEAGTLGQTSLDKIREVADSFLKHPFFRGGNEMAVQDAQAMKRQNYKELGDAAFGTGLRPAVERDALKGVTRGLRAGIEKVAPETATINAEMSPLINARDLAQDRVLTAMNRQPLGIGVLNPKTLLISLADRRELAKSILARGLHSGVAPYTGGAGAAAGGAIALGSPEEGILSNRTAWLGGR